MGQRKHTWSLTCWSVIYALKATDVDSQESTGEVGSASKTGRRPVRDSNEDLEEVNMIFTMRRTAGMGEILRDPRTSQERRRQTRSVLDLPFDFQAEESPEIHAGIVVNGSHGGLKVHALEDMPVGITMNITIFFAIEFELLHFAVVGKIIRKSRRNDKRQNGYEYGVKLIQISQVDYMKMRRLLS